MATTPLVTVVTPVHNGAAFIADSIESCLAQTVPDIVVRVVDNASTDATPEIVEGLARADSRIELVRFEQLVDAASNHERALRQVEPSSAFAKVLQADDLLFPECLERMTALARERPSVGMVSGYRLKGDVVDLVGLPFPQAFATGHAMLRQSLLGGPYVTGSPTSLLLRTGLVLERDPFYDREFEHWDTEAAYWALTRCDFALVHGIMTYSRRQPDARNLWSVRVKTYWAENIRMLLRYGPTVLTPEEFRKRLRYELSYYVRFHGKQRLKPTRWRDADFHRFHRRMVRVLREESDGDRDVALATTLVAALLNPGKEGGRPEEEHIHEAASSAP